MANQPETTYDTIGGLSLYQHRDGYRFSMDAVLLASFVSLKSARRIVDLGSGSGIVGLLLARRLQHAHVTLVELQSGLHALAGRNILENGLEGRVDALNADMQDCQLGAKQDVAVSNPPFRKPLSGLLSQGDERAIARHELRISLPGLIGTASRLLRERGRLYMIYLPERMTELFDTMRANALEPKRIRFVHGRTDMEARMMLIEAVRGGRPALKVEPPLFVYESDCLTYTPEVRAFYTQQ